MKKFILLCIGIVSVGMLPGRLPAQDFLKNAQITGSFQADAALYQTDAAMGITSQSLNGQPIRMNGFTEFNYEYKNISAGMRTYRLSEPGSRFSTGSATSISR